MSTIVPLHRKARMSPERAAELPPDTAADAAGERWGGLMVLAQDGDRDAYQRLLTEVSPWVRGIARRTLAGAGHADLEDAVQEVLLVLHQIRHTYERGRPFKPWLLTIASRRLIDFGRRRQYRGRHEVEACVPEDEAAPGIEDPADVASRHADARRVHDAVACLPPGQREAIELLRLRELSTEEATAASHQTRGALKVAAHRALKRLRRLLQSDDRP